MPADKVTPIALQSRNSGTLLAGTYKTLLAAGIDGACFAIRITNASNEDITISYDGVTDHEYLQDGETLELNFQTNARPANNKALLAKGTQVWVKGTAGAGFIYLSGWYQS